MRRIDLVTLILLLAVLGPDELWRLVTHRRDRDVRQPWVYREDIL